MNETEKTLISTLNTYAEMVAKGNRSPLAAMGRIIEELESSGKKVVVNEDTHRYELLEG